MEIRIPKAALKLVGVTNPKLVGVTMSEPSRAILSPAYSSTPPHVVNRSTSMSGGAPWSPSKRFKRAAGDRQIGVLHMQYIINIKYVQKNLLVYITFRLNVM